MGIANEKLPVGVGHWAPGIDSFEDPLFSDKCKLSVPQPV